jgi:hypothetical protein
MWKYKISKLETFDGKFPREAMEEAIERKNKIILGRLKMLKYAVKDE